MTDLNGERIEELLWEAGLDFHHTTEYDGVSSIEILVGESKVVVSESWAEEDKWYLDTDTALMEKYCEGVIVDSDFEPIKSEEDLVERALKLGLKDS